MIAADTLFSTDTVEFVLGLGEGPVAGLLKGPQSFFIGDTPLANAQGEFNFDKWRLDFYGGTADASKVRTVMGGTTSAQNVGIELATDVPVIRQTPANLRGQIDTLEVRIAVNALYAIDGKGRQVETKGEFEVLYRQVGTTEWLSAKEPTLVEVRPTGDQIDDKRREFALSYAAQLASNHNPWDEDSRANPSMYYGTAYNSKTVADQVDAWIDQYIAENSYTTSEGLIEINGKTSQIYIKEFQIDVDRIDGDWEVQVVKRTAEDNPKLVFSVSWQALQYSTKGRKSYPNTAVVRGIGVATDQLSSVPPFTSELAGKIIKIPANYNPVTRYYDGVWDGSWKLGFTDNPVWVLWDLLDNDLYGLRSYYPHLLLDRYSFYEAARYCDELVPIQGSEFYQPRWTYSDTVKNKRQALELLNYVSGGFGGILVSNMTGQGILKIDRPAAPVMVFGQESVDVSGFNYQWTDIAQRVNDVTIKFVNPALGWQQDVRRVFDQELIDRNGRIPSEDIAVGCIDPNEAERRAYRKILQANRETMTVNFTTTRAGISLQPFDIIGISDPDMAFGLSGRIKNVDMEEGRIDLRDPLLVPTNVTMNMMVQTGDGIVEIAVMAFEDYATRLFFDPALDLQIKAPQQFTLAGDGIGFVKPFRVLTVRPEGDAHKITALEVDVNKYGDVDNMTNSGTVFYDYDGAGKPSVPVIRNIESGTNQLVERRNGLQSRILIEIEPPVRSLVAEHQIRWRKRRRSAQWERKKFEGQRVFIGNVDDGQSYEFQLRAIDPFGRRSEWTELTRHTVLGQNQPPANPTGLVVEQDGISLRLRWDENTEIDFSHYEVFVNGDRVKKTVETEVQIGPKKLAIDNRIALFTVDQSGNVCEEPLVTDYVFADPSPLSFTITLEGPEYVVEITDPNSEADLKYTLLRDDTQIYKGSEPIIRKRARWTGTRTLTVVGTNRLGQVATAEGVDLTIDPPMAPALSYEFNSASITLNWLESQAGTLDVAYYRVYREDRLLVDQLKATSFSNKANWVGDKTFYVEAVDVAGNTSAAASVTVPTALPELTSLTSTVSKGILKLDWTHNDGTILTGDFIVKQDGKRIALVDAQTYSIPVDWTGTTTFEVIPRTVYRDQGGSLTVSETIDPPLAPEVTATLEGSYVALEWSEPASELPIEKYKVIKDGKVIELLDGNKASFLITGSGDLTYEVLARDSAKQDGASGSATISITPPQAPEVTSHFNEANVSIEWNEPASDVPIREYVILKEDTVLARGLFNAHTMVVDWGGTKTFKVKAIDTAGNESVLAYHDVTVQAPQPPAPTAEVLDNNVLLRWQNNPTTLPVVRTEVQREGRVEQVLDANFAAFFEFKSDLYTYGFVSIDSAGNRSQLETIQVTVAEPPDFVLQLNYDSAFDGARNKVLLENGKLLFGVDTDESYSEHFTNNSFASPQAQIDAGYPLYLQPTEIGNDAVYQEILDYGAVLSSTQVTVTPTLKRLAGNPNLEIDIEYRLDETEEWRGAYNRTQVFARNFRYVRITLRAVNDSPDDLLQVSNLNIVLSSKLRNDSGTGTAQAGGTYVPFNYDFVDVESISVSPKTSDPVIAVYDFEDTANPQGFTVYMFDRYGNPTSGPFSWAAKGY